MGSGRWSSVVLGAYAASAVACAPTSSGDAGTIVGDAGTFDAGSAREDGGLEAAADAPCPRYEGYCSTPACGFDLYDGAPSAADPTCGCRSGDYELSQPLSSGTERFAVEIRECPSLRCQITYSVGAGGCYLGDDGALYLEWVTTTGVHQARFAMPECGATEWSGESDDACTATLRRTTTCTPETLAPTGLARGGAGSASHDLDGDGDDELYRIDATGRIETYLGAPGGPATTPSRILVPPEPCLFPRFESVVAAGDLDGDGLGDLLAVATGGGASRVYVFRGGASGLAAMPAALFFGADGRTFAHVEVEPAGPVRMGGGPDVLLRTSLVSAPRALLTRVVDGAVEPSLTLARSALHAVADVNGDGVADLAAVDEVGSAVLVFTNVADAISGSPSSTLTATTLGSRSILDVFGPGDLDGNGYADLVVTVVQNDGRYEHLYVPAAAVGFADPVGLGVGPDHRLSAAGDTNGDGLADLVAASFDDVRTWLGNASGLAATPDVTFPHPVGTAGVDAPGDLDGDGRADLVFWRAAGFDLHLGTPTGPSPTPR